MAYGHGSSPGRHRLLHRVVVVCGRWGGPHRATGQNRRSAARVALEPLPIIQLEKIIAPAARKAVETCDLFRRCIIISCIRIIRPVTAGAKEFQMLAELNLKVRLTLWLLPVVGLAVLPLVPARAQGDVSDNAQR